MPTDSALVLAFCRELYVARAAGLAVGQAQDLSRELAFRQAREANDLSNYVPCLDQRAAWALEVLEKASRGTRRPVASVDLEFFIRMVLDISAPRSGKVASCESALTA